MTAQYTLNQFGVYELPLRSDCLSPDAVELILFAENTSSLYPQFKSIIKNISRKIEKGTYRPDLAPVLWQYWTDAAARQYQKEFGHWFQPAVRKEAAAYLAMSEYNNIVRGEYSEVAAWDDDFLRQYAMYTR